MFQIRILKQCSGSVHVTFCRQCNKYCTSGFVDDVENEACGIGGRAHTNKWSLLFSLIGILPQLHAGGEVCYSRLPCFQKANVL